MTRLPKNRPPTHPGDMLLEEFLIPMNITQKALADAIHVPYQRVNELINKKTGYYTEYCSALSPVFQYVSGLLAEPASALGFV